MKRLFLMLAVLTAFAVGETRVFAQDSTTAPPPKEKKTETMTEKKTETTTEQSTAKPSHKKSSRTTHKASKRHHKKSATKEQTPK